MGPMWDRKAVSIFMCTKEIIFAQLKYCTHFPQANEPGHGMFWPQFVQLPRLLSVTIYAADISVLITFHGCPIVATIR